MLVMFILKKVEKLIEIPGEESEREVVYGEHVKLEKTNYENPNRFKKYK